MTCGEVVGFLDGLLDLKVLLGVNPLSEIGEESGGGLGFASQVRNGSRKDA